MVTNSGGNLGGSGGPSPPMFRVGGYSPNFNTQFVAFNMALKVFGILEELNRSLQSRYQTVSGMLAAVADCTCNLLALRDDQVFDEMLSATNVIITDLDMIGIELPRQRRPPKRLTGDAPAHQYTTYCQ